MKHKQALTEFQRQHDHYAAVKRRLWGMQKRCKPAINDNVAEEPKPEPVQPASRKPDRWDFSKSHFDHHMVLWIRHKMGMDIMEAPSSRRSFDDICYDVLWNFPGLTLADIKGDHRGRKVVLARQSAQWLIHQERKDQAASFPGIGRWCGDRDHTTVLHSVKKIDAMIQRGELEWLRRLAS